MRASHVVIQSRLALGLATLLLGFAVPRTVGAHASLENPAPGSIQSGIGII